MALSIREAIGMSDTYTLSGLVWAKRIRFVREMYTFHSWRVYVLL